VLVLLACAMLAGYAGLNSGGDGSDGRPPPLLSDV